MRACWFAALLAREQLAALQSELDICFTWEQRDRRQPLLQLQVALVIYAPRKSVCDVYASRHGPLLATLQCGANCRFAFPYAPTSWCHPPGSAVCQPSTAAVPSY